MSDSPVSWPDVLRPGRFYPGLDPLAATGGKAAVSGRVKNNAAPTLGIWRPVYGDILIWTAAQRSALAEFEVKVLGRDRPINVPYLHAGIGPFVAGAATVTSVAADADAGDTSLSITKTAAGTLGAGHAFSIGTHLYKVHAVTAQDGASATVDIVPELRADIAAGATIRFDNPIVKCRLVDPRALSPDFDQAYKARITLQFIEDTTP